MPQSGDHYRASVSSWTTMDTQSILVALAQFLLLSTMRLVQRNSGQRGIVTSSPLHWLFYWFTTCCTD